MFKFTEATDGLDIWINPDRIISIEHERSEVGHRVAVVLEQDMIYHYDPESEEDCRQFLFDLFQAMGQEYKYEG